MLIAAELLLFSSLTVAVTNSGTERSAPRSNAGSVRSFAVKEENRRPSMPSVPGGGAWRKELGAEIHGDMGSQVVAGQKVVLHHVFATEGGAMLVVWSASTKVQDPGEVSITDAGGSRNWSYAIMENLGPNEIAFVGELDMRDWNPKLPFTAQIPVYAKVTPKGTAPKRVGFATFKFHSMTMIDGEGQAELDWRMKNIP